MEDTFNNDATSNEELDTSVQPEVQTEVEHEVQTEVEQEAPPAPMSRREALEAAFKKVEEKAAKELKPEETAPPQETTTPVVEPAPKPSKAPAGWKPTAKAKFDTLDAELQEEITKREVEISRRLNESAQERKIASDFIKVTQPYHEHFKQLGVHPMAAAEELLKTGYTLHTGTMEQKVQIAANMIKNFKIDVAALDGALAGGQGVVAAPASIAPEIDQRLARIEQTFMNQQKQQQEAQIQEVNKAIESFASDPKNEFFNDVAVQMVGLLQADPSATLQSAYEQACWANPSVRKALLAKEEANKQRLNAAGATLTNNGPRGRTGLAPLNAKGKTRREILDQLVPKDNVRI